MNKPTEINKELLDTLESVAADSEKLEQVLNRLFQMLAKNGIEISFDVSGMIRGINRGLTKAKKQGTSMIEQLEQFEKLVNIFTRLTASLELDEVLVEVIDTIISFTGAERAYLMLKEKKSGELKVHTARNWDRESLSTEEASFSSTVVRLALEQGTAIITTNAQSDNRFEGMQSVVSQGLRSILAIPLIVRAKAVGVLYVDNRIEQDIFKQESIPLLTVFGTQAAIAIENATQYGKVKEDLQKAQTELKQLKIEIDQRKVSEQINEITESDFFQKLSAEARTMRRRFGSKDES
jgi:GAF domain-containing protein